MADSTARTTGWSSTSSSRIIRKRLSPGWWQGSWPSGDPPAEGSGADEPVELVAGCAEGVRTADLPAAERARVRRDHIGFVFQQDNLIPSLTALEQVLLAVDLRRGSRRAHRTLAMELLEQVGLADAADRRPHQLSGGMRQRVNIARSLMGSPSLLLVDEPTSVLDRERGRRIIALLAELVRDRGVATVVVSHDLDALDPGGSTGVDVTASMADGRIVRVEHHRLHAGARFVETPG
ncbi:ABC transporter ATP-binding protein [Streptomyces sp. BE303]|uniref:ABC transporter ATP-binding protein n=1 Tax=Streptomyces sp. BE303 TaxID=3002528 RepID=UPI002E782223|nr:ATP-binding cassette domain-containing protein [Streptomyces sp. BE303]MED7952286.1 ATP-binding cassette domain-containing protein [Streptomyces sp. BE303]